MDGEVDYLREQLNEIFLLDGEGFHVVGAEDVVGLQKVKDDVELKLDFRYLVIEKRLQSESVSSDGSGAMKCFLLRV